MFKGQTVLSNITDIDPLKFDQKLVVYQLNSCFESYINLSKIKYLI